MSVVIGGCPVLESISELLMYGHHWSNASKHLCDATVRLQTSASHMITGMMYTLYNLILVGRDIQEFQTP